MNPESKKQFKIDIKNIDFDSLLNKDTALRRADSHDIFGNACEQNIIKNDPPEKIKKYRLQGEYGEKKFIKP